MSLREFMNITKAAPKAAREAIGWAAESINGHQRVVGHAARLKQIQAKE